MPTHFIHINQWSDISNLLYVKIWEKALHPPEVYRKYPISLYILKNALKTPVVCSVRIKKVPVKGKNVLFHLNLI